MKSLHLFTSSFFFVAIIFLSTIVSAQSTLTLPDGLYCGGNKTGTMKALLQIHASTYASILLTVPSSSSSSIASQQKCEMQFLLSKKATVNNNIGGFSLPWTLVKTTGSVCSKFSLPSATSASTLDYQIVNGHFSVQTVFTYNNEIPNDTLYFGDQDACSQKLGYKVSPWIPSGFYCADLSSSLGVTVNAPNNAIEIDLMGYALTGSLTVNTNTGALTVKVANYDISSMLKTATYNSTTGVIVIVGSYSEMNINVNAARTFCKRPDAIKNDNLIPTGTYCGYAQTSKQYVALTLAEAHLFTLNYGGICTAQGIYTETTTSNNNNNLPTVNLYFSQFYDCLANISVVSVVANSAANNYSSISITLSGGDNLLDGQVAQNEVASINRNDESCQMIPGLPSWTSIPNGLYCLPKLDESILPGGTLSVAIFGSTKNNQKQFYQLWSGACEAHGFFTIDSSTGVITLFEDAIGSQCPEAIGTSVIIAGLSWHAYKAALVVDVSYQGMIINVAAKQNNCPLLKPSNVITALPSGLFCTALTSSNPPPGQFGPAVMYQQLVTIAGNTIDVTLSSSCSLHGFYTNYHPNNGFVDFNLTSSSDSCINAYLHTVSFTPGTPLQPSSVRVQGFYGSQPLDFTASNCSSANQQPAGTKEAENLCFQLTDANQNSYWGYMRLQQGYARYSIGECIITGIYTSVDNDNVVLGYSVLSTSAGCNGMSIALTQFSANGYTASLSVTRPGANTVTISASTHCPVPQSTIATSTQATTNVVPTKTETQPPTTLTSASNGGIVPPTQPTTQTTAIVTAPSTVLPTGNPTGAPVPTTPPITTATNAPTTNAPTTTSTLAPTLPIGTYTFTANSLSGSLSVSPTAVVLEIGQCSQNGNLQKQQGSSTNSYNFVANTKSDGCSSTQISGMSFAVDTSSNSNTNNNQQSLTVTGSVNGKTFSAAAVETSSSKTTTSAPTAESSSKSGMIAGIVVAIVVVLAIVGVLYMRKKSSSRGTGDDTIAFQDVRTQNPHLMVNEEMLTNAISQYHNYDERHSTQGDASTLEI